MIGFMKYWLLGFRTGWYSVSPVPPAAWSSPDPLNIAYYKGYAWAQDVRDRMVRR